MAYSDSNNKLDWAMSFQRTGTFPLDRSSIFSSFEDATKYAKGSGEDPDSRGLCGTSYVGQIIVVYSDDEVSAYIIDSERNLEKLAATASSGDLAGDVKKLQGEMTQALGDIGTLKSSVETINTNLGQAQTDISGLKENSATKTDLQSVTTNVTDLQGRMTTAEGDITAVKGRMDTAEGDITKLKSQITNTLHYIGVSTTDPAIGTVTIGEEVYADPKVGDVVFYNANNTEFAWNGTTWEELGSGDHISRTEVSETYATKESVQEVSGRVDGIDAKFANYATTEAMTGAIATETSAREQADTALDGRIDALETASGTYLTKTDAENTYVKKEEGKSLVEDADITKLKGLANIKSVGAEFTLDGESGELSVKQIAQSKVEGLSDALAGKADDADVSGVSDRVGVLETAVGESADPASAEGSIYARIAQLKADVAVAGKVDDVKVNGVSVVSDKVANIPLASDSAVGVVKSSTGDGAVQVTTDGTMKVNTFKASALTQSAEEYYTLVIDGGNAALSAETVEMLKSRRR